MGVKSSAGSAKSGRHAQGGSTPGGVEPVSRTWRGEVARGRAIVYAGACLEGALVVTFFVSVQLLLNRHYFSLSGAQHGTVYVPLLAAAVLAALFATKRSRHAVRGRVLRIGLTLSAVGRAVLIPTILGAVRHAAVFFPDLVIASTLTGAGFGLVYSAATAFALDIDPARPERHLLRLTLTLAAGMAAGPLLQIGLIEAGLWWVLPLIATVLVALLIALSSQSRLGPDAARSCALSHPAKRVPVRVKAYTPVALIAVAAVVICVAWSQARMIGSDPDGIGTRALGLGAFWAALTVLAVAAFSAIDLRPSWRRSATLGLFFLPAVVTVVGLAIGQAETAVVGIFLLAALACAALLPPASQLTQRQLLALPLTVGAGIIAIYPVTIALARPSLSGLRSSGVTLPVTFAVTGIVAIAAFLICVGLIASRRAYPDQGGTLGPAESEATAATHGATAAALPPLHARPCTAVEPPRQKTVRHDDEDQPGAQSERSHP
jgi:MFS family permease